MKKIAAASAALSALVFGLVIAWTVVAQNRDRSAETASVRASLVIRHVIQEGENLTTDDGRYGPGGIMQHYLGRHRSGDIGRLRAYDGNRRAIWVTRCEWPEDVPDEERTTLQECPDSYARYSIRRSVGRVIEIPLRWIPTSRFAELTRTTPGIARDMRRIAAVMNAPGQTMVREAPVMADEDPVVDAPVASPTGTGTDSTPDAGTDSGVTSTAGNSPDAGVVVAGNTNGGGNHGGGEDTSSDDTWFTTVLQWIAIGVAALAGLMLLINLGLVLRRLTPSEIAAIKKELALLWTSAKRRWTAYKRLRRQKAILARMQRIDPTMDSDEIAAAHDRRKEAEHVLRQIGTQLGAPDVEAEPAETYAKRFRVAMYEHAKQAATVIQKAALVTGKPSADYPGIVAELQQKMQRTMTVPVVAPPPPPGATSRLDTLEREKADLAAQLTAAQEESIGLNESFAKEISEMGEGHLKRVAELEAQLGEVRARNVDLEKANGDFARSIASGGRPARDDTDGELPNDETKVIHINDVDGTPGSEPLPGAATSPGVGLGEVEGAPKVVGAPTAVRGTFGYEQMHQREDEQTVPVQIPRASKVPEDEALAADTDNESDPPSHMQPVMCGCGKKFHWDEWAAHADICLESDKMEVLPAAKEPSKVKVRSRLQQRKDQSKKQK